MAKQTNGTDDYSFIIFDQYGDNEQSILATDLN